eukprot:gnl/MRDRNA2_/MRDRNA2_83355_c0_seq5.p1 gnl/MRDRNA2_/MRDRNA2_83355_c0~~gnl/MRDRNA2_/MRDRNA2_83355_c0_seq5.p1  ORF type:complete len:211 (-),score=59.27 gnl/MRDRNA2_/MRDRNA2_83355_c0_seq5:706-1338(-)
MSAHEEIDLDTFVSANSLDDRVAEKLKELPQKSQQIVMFVVDQRKQKAGKDIENPSAFVWSQVKAINDPQSDGAGRVKYDYVFALVDERCQKALKELPYWARLQVAHKVVGAGKEVSNLSAFTFGVIKDQRNSVQAHDGGGGMDNMMADMMMDHMMMENVRGMMGGKGKGGRGMNNMMGEMMMAQMMMSGMGMGMGGKGMVWKPQFQKKR